MKANDLPEEDITDATREICDGVRPFLLTQALVSLAEYEAYRAIFHEAWINKNEEHRKFLMACLNYWHTTDRRDETTFGYIMPCQLVAQLAGKKWTSNFTAGEWFDLLDVWADRIEMTLYTWNHPKGLARTLHIIMPSEIREARIAAKMTPEEAADYALPAPPKARDRVLLSTGVPMSRRQKAAERENFVKERDYETDAAPDGSIQKIILSVINGHVTERATTINNALKDGIPNLVRSYNGWNNSPIPLFRHGKAVIPTHELQYRDNVGCLIESFTEDECALYGYRGSFKSTRCHAFGRCVNHLPRDLRKAVLSHLTTLDLQSSQLAFGAKLWGAEVVTARLKACLEGVSIWGGLLAELGMPAEAKPAIKAVIYPGQFGMTRKNLRVALFNELKDLNFTEAESKPIVTALFRCELMSDLLSARKRRIDKIMLQGGITLPAFSWKGKHYPARRVPLTRAKGHVLSLLAMEMQFCEELVLLEVLDVVTRYKGVTVVSWLHDGLTLAFADETKRESQTRQIIKAANKKCKEFDVITSLSGE